MEVVVGVSSIRSDDDVVDKGVVRAEDDDGLEDVDELHIKQK